MAKLLLDTHVLLFAFSRPSKIGATARSLILSPTNDVYFSVASAWEVAVKNAKFPRKMPFTIDDFLGCCSRAGYRELPLNSLHVQNLRKIDTDPDNPLHADPFDRMLMCQAEYENMLLLTQDSKILAYTFGNIIDSRK